MSKEITWDDAMERAKQRRKSRIESITFRFGGEYKVHTQYPYIKWTVRWGCNVIGEFNFDDANVWQPERTVTLARARECFEKSTVIQKVK